MICYVRHSYLLQFHNMQQANCITVATSTDEDEKDKSGNMPVVILDNRHQQQMSVPSSMHYVQNNQAQRCQQAEKIIMTSPSPIMTSCTTLTTLQPQQVNIFEFIYFRDSIMHILFSFFFFTCSLYFSIKIHITSVNKDRMPTKINLEK